MLNCNNCQKDLSSSKLIVEPLNKGEFKLTNYQEEKDLLICAQCWGENQPKYKDYEVSHFCLYKRSGKIDGSSEAVVVWDFK